MDFLPCSWMTRGDLRCRLKSTKVEHRMGLLKVQRSLKGVEGTANIETRKPRSCTVPRTWILGRDCTVAAWMARLTRTSNKDRESNKEGLDMKFSRKMQILIADHVRATKHRGVAKANLTSNSSKKTVL
jgi:hypothetical protein